MITVADLKTHTVKDLSAMARKLGLTGIHAMRKDQLVRAVAKAARSKSTGGKSRRLSGKASSGGSSRSTRKTTRARGGRSTQRSAGANGQSKTRAKTAGGRSGKTAAVDRSTTPRNQQVARKLRKASTQREQRRDLSHAGAVATRNAKRARKRKVRRTPASAQPAKDRIVLLVRDAYWLQACWDITRHNVDRAKAALAENWHTCRPVLRLLRVETGATTSTTEQLVREIPIHGGVRNWYIDLQDSPNSYRVDIGYRYADDGFHAMARSNTVTTPRPGSSDDIDENWSDIAENYERVFAMSGGYEPSSEGGDLQQVFEERLRRPMGNPIVGTMGGASQRVIRRDQDFDFEVDAEMIVYGATKANAHVTLAGKPVRLRPDGSFTVRMSLPDRRQVLPVVACSRDGVEQRTVVLAVERNTKVMEPQRREPEG